MQGIDVNAVSSVGTPAIEFAAYFGNKGAIEVLLEAGADPSIGEGDGILDEVCGCVNNRGNPDLIQCPEGTCLTPEQTEAIEILLGRRDPPVTTDPPEEPVPAPNPLPSTKTRGSVPLLIEEPVNEDCSSFSSLVAQLECVAAANAATP